MDNFRKPPVEIAQELELEIIGKDEEKHPDDRTAKVDNYIVFIKDCHAEVGEKIKVEITAALPKYGFAKLVEE